MVLCKMAFCRIMIMVFNRMAYCRYSVALCRLGFSRRHLHGTMGISLTVMIKLMLSLIIRS